MKATGGAFEDFDGFKNVLFAFFAEAGDVAKFTFFGDAFDIVDGAGLKMTEEEGDFFRAEGLEIEQFENALGIFFEEFLAEAVVAGFNDFSEMFDHAFPPMPGSSLSLSGDSTIWAMESGRPSISSAAFS